MRQLPDPTPGNPATSSPVALLMWIARHQASTLAGGMTFGIMWMLCQALLPAILGRALDSLGDAATTARWVLLVLAIGIVQAIAGVMRHRFAVTNWLRSAYRTQQSLVRHAVRLGGSLPTRISTGEVVAIGSTDVEQMSNLFDVLPRFVGAVVALVVVAVILLNTSVALGLVVLLGVPALVLLLGVFLRPLHHAQREQREVSAAASTVAADVVNGLRILRGIGGEDQFAARYNSRSARLRDSGIRVARVETWLDGMQILLPGLFTVVVTGLGARLTLDGTITPGQLVAFYGYAAFLVTPIRTFAEAADQSTKALVSAGRVLTVLRLQPAIPDASALPPIGQLPASGARLHDPASGVLLEPGRLVCLVTGTTEDGALVADRLGRHTDVTADQLAVTFGGRDVRDLPLGWLRSQIQVMGIGPHLFGGQLLVELDPTGHADLARVEAAVYAAAAADAVAVCGGLQHGELEERGRSVSGGQRQRLSLARALVADSPILILVEPTSAVDAATEDLIAERVSALRAGLTTLVVTTSPLWLERADEVLVLSQGRLAERGRHEDLLASSPRYLAIVGRGGNDADTGPNGDPNGEDDSAGIRPHQEVGR